MGIFSTHIVVAIKKIRTQKGTPDSDKIFKETVKESATNITRWWIFSNHYNIWLAMAS